MGDAAERHDGEQRQRLLDADGGVDFQGGDELLKEALLLRSRRRGLANCVRAPIVCISFRVREHVDLALDFNAVETQLARLSERDGKIGDEAAMLIECMDEFALPVTTEWDQIMPAVGDFRDLATNLHQRALKNSRRNSKEVFF